MSRILALRTLAPGVVAAVVATAVLSAAIPGPGWRGLAGPRTTQVDRPAGLESATAAANRDLVKFAEAAFKANHGRDYGFLPADRVDALTLAEPVPVFGLDMDLRGRNPRTVRVADLVEWVGEWMFPVVAQGTYRTLLGVRQIKGQWRGAFLGNPYLAGRLQALRAAWSTPGVDRFQLVSSTSPRAFLFTVMDHPQENLTPLTRLAVGADLRLDPPPDLRDLMEAGKVFSMIQEARR